MPLDRLAAAGDPKLRRVLLYARSRRDQFTAHDVALALGVHRNVARNRLDRLADAGFLAVTLERLSGRAGPGAGRPAKIYRVASELEGVEFPDRRLAELIGLLIGKIPRRGRERALREAGEDFGRTLAAASKLRASRSVGSGLERLCAALGSLGFHASVHSLEGDTAVLETATCPLRPLIVTRPESAGIDHGMWAGLVEQAIRDVRAESVKCETPRCLPRDVPCSVLLSLGDQTATAASPTAG